MRFLLLTTFLFSISSFSTDLSTGLPNGHFAGHGSWTSNQNENGKYETYVEILDNELRFYYAWDSGDLNENLTFRFNNEGCFDVIYRGAAQGEGFCNENYCTYKIVIDGGYYEETLYFCDDGETLIKAGSKKVNDQVVKWRDVLEQVNISWPWFPVVPPPPHILPIPDAHQLRITT